MNDRESSYYPQRATFLSPLRGYSEACRDGLKKLAWHGPDNVTLLGLVGSIVVPGLAIYLRQPNRSGKAALLSCGALLSVFIVFLGFPVANMAFTVLLSIHLIGLVAYCKPMFAGAYVPYKLLGGLSMSLVSFCLVYLPARNVVEHRAFLPMRVHGHIVVVNCLRSRAVVHPGDFIAFRVEGDRNFYQNSGGHGTVMVVQGVNLAPVLAMAGDQVQFTPDSCLVNGRSYPHRKNMPDSGGFTVPGKCWFVWPDLGIGGYGNVPSNMITEATMEIAVVNQKRFIGTAFKHWFGRRQVLT